MADLSRFFDDIMLGTVWNLPRAIRPETPAVRAQTRKALSTETEALAAKLMPHLPATHGQLKRLTGLPPLDISRALGLLKKRGKVTWDNGVWGEAMIAALFVQTGGCYYGIDGVDPWDEARDARLYKGPWPVVCHSPCPRWGKFYAGQPLWIKQTGERKVKGDDDGCFASALDSVRRYGGVLEHPEGSHAWAHFGLNKPPRDGGWITADFHGGWTCCVEQGRYGHYARKPTWLLVYGVAEDNLPELRWGKSEASYPPEVIAKHGLAYCKRAGELAFKGGGKDSPARIGTPPEFRDLLLSIAETADVTKPVCARE